MVGKSGLNQYFRGLFSKLSLNMRFNIPFYLLILTMFLGSCSNYYLARQHQDFRETMAGGTDIKSEEGQKVIVPEETLSNGSNQKEKSVFKQKIKDSPILQNIGKFSKKWMLNPLPVSNITGSFTSTKKKNLTGWEIVLIILLVVLALSLLRLLGIDLASLIISALVIVALVLLILWLIGEL
jgi:hypothetical protein